ncbi:potassium channel subfamily T member 2 isoform X3 [Adelges cooleyi]|uniref:potassium channel subfamily T member 2 isoform X3 n=1 Tax=Adelges cooleyi TaxID=133065 RepID=UPI00217FE34B|nr:potassium channel subfamily T member 2 isoform X3 [Adelges cooleyi]
MSMFFFRLHNLRREEEIKKRRKRGMRHRHQLTLAPSRLFEKPPLTPSDSLDEVALQIPRVRVEYYVNENTFKERLQIYFIKNQRSSLRIRIVNLFFKLLTCLLYIIRVVLDQDPTFATCYGCQVGNKTEFLLSRNLTDEAFQARPIINWDAIQWVKRPFELWILECGLAVFALCESLLLTYIGYKGNVMQQLLSFHFILELITTVPFIFTLFQPTLINLFIPVFLNCWLAKKSLENMFNDLHRAMQKSQSALSQQLMILSATLLCLVFTSVCGIQHFQRAGHRHLSLFQATYYVVVTFSTVGYGDFVPDIWPSQLYMVVMICIALIVLPTQFEQLAFTWMERQKLGGSYSSHRAHSEKHVVVCSTTLQADTIMDFLNEFYAHPLLQDYFVVLLSPMELDTTMRMILQVPIWAQRVIYIQGSCLKDGDLSRARMSDAKACFVLAARNYADKAAADEHTILRSWAVKDYAPTVPQYVQIFRPENKLHVKFAEFVVCEDELKYALLANNCTCPGASTLVTLLLHTSRGQEGQTSPEEWHRLYGRCSGNEIYHILLGDSRFFGEYEGKSFTYASFHSHRKFGVSLVGVRPADLPEFYEDTILLNPGPRHIMKKSDICYYISVNKEENSSFVLSNSGAMPAKQLESVNSSCGECCFGQIGRSRLFASMTVQISFLDKPTDVQKTIKETHTPPSKHSDEPMAVGNHLSIPKPIDMNPNLLSPEILNQRRGSRRPSILPVAETMTGSSLNISVPHPEDGDESEDELEDEVPWRSPSEKIAIVKGFPPVSPYIGVSPTLCYLLKEKKPLCCLQLAQVCEHCSYRNATDYNWQNKTIILAADYASNGIYNFIIPLRAHFHPKTSLNPIIILLERRPDIAFLDAISYFPLVYWMLGSIDCLDDLLRAGILLAENVVVVNKELSNSAEEETLADCNTIVAVQTMFKFFPNIRSITELSQSSNMRFMQFRAQDTYALHLSKMEKHEKERGSHISYMFRLPFAAGSVFSASMLDTLLYQAFVKDYVITFVRLLLGVDQAPGSGFLTSMKITKDDMWIRTYGRLYQKLCSTTCEIPLGIYRTQDLSNIDSPPDACGTDCDKTSEGSDHEAYMPIPTNCLPNCHRNQNSVFSINMNDDARDNHDNLIERAEIVNLVRSRMDSLNLPSVDHEDVSEKRSSLSYVIINPSCDLKLEEGDIIYILRPSPFSAQKTFERHNSRRKSNISFSSQTGQIGFGSRRGSTLAFPPFMSRPPPLVTTKSNSLSLPDSPTVGSALRARSNSLRVVDDILMRRSNSLRQGLSMCNRKSSLEELGVSHFALGSSAHERRPSMQVSLSARSMRHVVTTRRQSELHPSEMSGSAIKIALNGSIGLEVTPPEEVSSPGLSSNTSVVTGGPSSLPAQQQLQSVPSVHHQPASPSPVLSPHSSQEHLQGTIV